MGLFFVEDFNFSMGFNYKSIDQVFKVFKAIIGYNGLKTFVVSQAHHYTSLYPLNFKTS